ncbi:hypothetical protein A2U01_0088927, partial [Trifolium medium]|nr:hypothetical protein [Trifolium medium]
VRLTPATMSVHLCPAHACDNVLSVFVWLTPATMFPLCPANACDNVSSLSG